MKTKALSVGGTFTYAYDTGTNGKGKLVSVTQTGGDGYYYDGYDTMGRVAASRQMTTAGASNTYTMSYGYDLAGNMTSQTYPSGRIIQTDYDSAERISGVRRQSTEMYYAGGPVGSGGIQYAPTGAVKAMVMGNGRWEHTTFNSRLQPTQIGLGNNAFDSTLLRLDYTYNTPGQANNNGDVLTQTIVAPTTGGGTATMSQTYDYTH